MEDSEIIRPYFARSEDAIAESDKKYGAVCRRISDNILHSARDTEECVNDTWLTAWKRIPPEQPEYLGAYLSKITRNLSLACRRKRSAEKRKTDTTAVCIEELYECLPDTTHGDMAGEMELRETLDGFLRSLKPRERVIFIKRYWYVASVKEIAGELAMNAGGVKMSLSRTRGKLKQYLEREGYTV